jgi:hypothetical protein
MPRKTKSVVSSSITGHESAAKSININSTPPSLSFHDLPLEIRTIIYGFVFGNRIVDIHQRNGPCRFPNPYYLMVRSKTRRNTRKAAQDLQAFRTQPSTLAIASTCRQFYQEAVKIWYQNARFFFYSKQCMMQFLDDIGDSNRAAIWHVGCSGRMGPDEWTTKYILEGMQTLVNMRSVTFEDVGNFMILDGQPYTADTMELENAKTLKGWWEEKAQEWIRHTERLESVFVTSKLLKMQFDYYRAKATMTIETTELKLYRCGGEILKTTSTVEREFNEGGPRSKKIAICTRGAHSSIQRTLN